MPSAPMPTNAVAHGGVSVYAGLTPVGGSILGPTSTAVPASAGLPWDEAASARADGKCGYPKVDGGVCHANPAGATDVCYGHARSVINGLIGLR